MGYYSEVDLFEINEILKHYDFGNASSFEATVTGISNSNYRVTLEDGRDILLKISNDKTIEQLKNEQKILQVLQKYKYPYSLHPFETILGKPIYEHGGMHGVVFPFVKGLPPIMDESACIQIGSALGQLHSLKIDAEDLASIRSYSVVGYGGVSISEYARSIVCPKDFEKSFHEIFPEGLESLPYEDFPVGIIHGDLYFDNSLFFEESLVTLIDFEQSGRGRHILDLGIAISGSCLDKGHDNIDEVLLKAFLKGYESKRKLLVLEKKFLETAILVGFFSIALWRIKRFFEGSLDERKKFNYRELLNRAKRFKESNIEI